MATDSYIKFVRDLLADIGPLRIRRIFGGAGVHSADLFFDVVLDDTLVFKVDDRDRSDYADRGFGPFTYKMTNGRIATMSSYPVPPEILDDPDLLTSWARKAVGAAGRAMATTPIIKRKP